MSSFRSISLCGASSDLLCFDLAYQIGVSGVAREIQPEMSPSFWRNAHEAATMYEWEKAVDGMLGTEELMRAPLRLWLIAQGPSAVLRASISSNEEPEAKKLAQIMPTAKRRAAEVVKRRTVFLLPENELDLEPLAKLNRCDVSVLIEKLAEQLYQLLENEQANDFTFVRVGHHTTGRGVLDRIIEHLHSRLTTGILDQAKISRAGPVLFIGPTGTGKSYAARLLAKMIGRTKFVHVNLSAVTEGTLESRIRGYVAGAFTDANRKGSSGWFEQAHGGVLFLDEFQSVPVAYQTQLLDLLEAVSDRVTVARMGQDNHSVTSNVKVILAVNEDLDELLRSGRLRHDLFYRMRHLVRFPALNQRFSDPKTKRLTLGILLKTYRWRLAPRITEDALPQHINAPTAEDELTKSRLRSMFPIIEDAAIDRLLEHKWPGNLRELERVINDMFCDCDSDSDGSQDPIIRSAQVNEAIDSFGRTSFSLDQPKQQVDSMSKGGRTLLSDVESTLRDNGFVIERTLGQLKETHPMYRLRSRRSLRRFLIENIGALSEDIRTHRAMMNFMNVQEISPAVLPAPVQSLAG